MFEVPDTTKPDVDDSFIDLGGLDEFFECFENDPDFRKKVRLTFHEKPYTDCKGALGFGSTLYDNTDCDDDTCDPRQS